MNKESIGSTKNIGFWQIGALCAHAFFSIRSNSPHNGPLPPLCGWVFHIECRQRRPNLRLTVLEIFCIFYANAPEPHTISILGWRHRTSNVSWVKIHCCFVAEQQIEFLPSYKSHLSWKRAIARQALSEWMLSIFFFVIRGHVVRQKCEILFALANPILDWCSRSRLQIWKGDSASGLMQNSP